MTYTCAHCPKTYEIYASYASHRRTHREPIVKCDKCLKLFANHPLLYKHAYQSGCTKSVPIAASLPSPTTTMETPRSLSLLSGFLSSGSSELGTFYIDPNHQAQ